MTDVICTSSHPVDVEPDGRTLAPGETDNVNLRLPHNRALADAGALRVLDDQSQSTDGDNEDEEN